MQSSLSLRINRRHNDIISSFSRSLFSPAQMCRELAALKHSQRMLQEQFCDITYWLLQLFTGWSTAISTESAASSDEQRWTVNDSSVDWTSLIASVVCCVIDFTGCQFHNGYSTSFVCWSTRLYLVLHHGI